MILEDIKNKLLTLNLPVYYGMAEDITNLDILDYIVFLRDTSRYSATKNSFSDYFIVAVVNENYIIEDFDKQVINKVCELSGFRVADDDISYEYTKKPNTNIILEILTIKFVRARK